MQISDLKIPTILNNNHTGANLAPITVPVVPSRWPKHIGQKSTLFQLLNPRTKKAWAQFLDFETTEVVQELDRAH